MKVLVVGGVPSPDGDVARLHHLSAELGAALYENGHELVICSTEPSSADAHVVRGYLAAARGNAVKVAAHLPQQEPVERWTEELERSNPTLLLSPTWHQTPKLDNDDVRSYAYLMCQLLAALDCDLIVAFGGAPGRAMDLLLMVASAQGKPIAPLRWLDGAAAAQYRRDAEDLKLLLDLDVQVLDAEDRIGEVPALFDRLTHRTRPSNDTFFISYSRTQAAFADIVENVLRAKGLHVSRDEVDLDIGSEWRAEIDRAVEAAGVVVVLWSVAYVSSPHCFAEMTKTLELRGRSGGTSPELWVFPLDKTRMTFPGVDDLLHAEICTTRDVLRTKLIARVTTWRGS